MAEATQAPVVEEVKNCPACKKPLKKARRFYRNGAYYCNNNCFKKIQATAKTEAAEKAAQKAAEKVAEKPAEKSEEKPQA
jgi:hypothetical protein